MFPPQRREALPQNGRAGFSTRTPRGEAAAGDSQAELPTGDGTAGRGLGRRKGDKGVPRVFGDALLLPAKLVPCSSA